MEKICPVCNCLQTIDRQCPVCGQQMMDGGALENYFGPYSPYMDNSSFTMPFDLPDTHCVHLLYCPCCHYDIRAAWELVTI